MKMIVVIDLTSKHGPRRNRSDHSSLLRAAATAALVNTSSSESIIIGGVLIQCHPSRVATRFTIKHRNSDTRRDGGSDTELGQAFMIDLIDYDIHRSSTYRITTSFSSSLYCCSCTGHHLSAVYVDLVGYQAKAILFIPGPLDQVGLVDLLRIGGHDHTHLDIPYQQIAFGGLLGSRGGTWPGDQICTCT